MLCLIDTTYLVPAAALPSDRESFGRREGMERLTHSAIRPAGDGLLRYGYVPPSLQRLHGQVRERRAGQVVRLTLIACAATSFLVNVYRDTQRASAAPAQHARAASVSPVATAHPAAGVTAPVVSLVASPAVAVPTPAPTAAAIQPPERPDPAAVALPPDLPAEAVLPPVRRVPAVTQGRLPAPTAAPVSLLDTTGLTQALQRILAGATGTYGVTVIDLTSNQEVNINATGRMNAASVNKLEILAALYHECALGRLRLDQTVTTSAADIQDYGTGVIRYQPVGTTYTLGQLARLLIEQSDNTASYLLAQTIGLSTIDALVAKWGLASTVVGQEISSPHDAARFMQLLYEGKLANPAATGQMLAYLTHTAFNDRIPAGVPAGVSVAHKIGTQVNVENDVAIVDLAGRPYVLSIFARDVTEERAVPVEQAISRSVYQFETLAKGAS